MSYLEESICANCEHYNHQKNWCEDRQTTPPSSRAHCSIWKKSKKILEGEEILRHPSLFQMIITELDKTIVKETRTKKTIILVTLGGKLVQNASPTSKNLMINDESGAGKDHVTRQVLKIIPPQDVIIRKRITPAVFTYWHNSKTEKEWTWDGKIFYNEDISNQVLNCDVFKVMSSSDGINHSTVICKQKVQEVITVGKPVMIITIAMAYPSKELLRRYPICNLDISKEQTLRILEFQSRCAIKGQTIQYDKKIIQAINLLKTVKVRIGFADLLVRHINHQHVIIRTNFPRLLDYIKFSAAIHQYQREIDEDGFLQATPYDYEIAREVLLKTTQNTLSIPLTRKQQKILEIFKNLSQELKYSVSELEKFVTWCSEKTLRRDLDKLTEDGFLIKDREPREGSPKPVMIYGLAGAMDIFLPKWEEITK